MARTMALFMSDFMAPVRISMHLRSAAVPFWIENSTPVKAARRRLVATVWAVIALESEFTLVLKDVTALADAFLWARVLYRYFVALVRSRRKGDKYSAWAERVWSRPFMALPNMLLTSEA